MRRTRRSARDIAPPPPGKLLYAMFFGLIAVMYLMLRLRYR